jgi:hypothetical protein
MAIAKNGAPGIRVFLVVNPMVRALSKHIEIYFHFIKEGVLNKQLEIFGVPLKNHTC